MNIAGWMPGPMEPSGGAGLENLNHRTSAGSALEDADEVGAIGVGCDDADDVTHNGRRHRVTRNPKRMATATAALVGTAPRGLS